MALVLRQRPAILAMGAADPTRTLHAGSRRADTVSIQLIWIKCEDSVLSRDCLVIALIVNILVESLFDSASRCSQAVAKWLRVLRKNNPMASKVAAVWFRMTGQKRRVGCAILLAPVRRRPNSGLTLPSGLGQPLQS
jgi:hypothetical protein